MPLFLDGESDVSQGIGSQHWHRYDRGPGPGRKVWGAAADSSAQWYLAELLSMRGRLQGAANLSSRACAQCPVKSCCPWQPVPVRPAHSLSTARDMPWITSWADLTMQSCGKLAA